MHNSAYYIISNNVQCIYVSKRDVTFDFTESTEVIKNRILVVVFSSFFFK